MSMLDNPPHVADIKRLSEIGNGKRSVQVIAEAVPCFIQPLSAEASATYGMAVGTGFMMFTVEEYPVQTGDQVIHEGQTYGVRAVQYFNFGFNPHYEIALTKEVK